MTKFDIISDLHYTHHTANNPRKIGLYIKNFIKPKSDNIIIAGDISNSIADTLSFLKHLKRYYYQKILVVLGNHDHYFSNSESDKFDNYEIRAKYLVEEIKKLGVIVLDGQIEEIDGVRISGCTGWYDFSYTQKLNPCMTAVNIMKYWYRNMNDGNYIKGMIKDTEQLTWENMQAWSFSDKEKISKVYDQVDIIVTHISPLNEPFFAYEPYKYDLLTGAYFFNGMGFAEYSNAKYWIYGHTHVKQEYLFGDTKFISNPVGYPFENKKFEAIQIILDI